MTDILYCKTSCNESLLSLCFFQYTDMLLFERQKSFLLPFTQRKQHLSFLRFTRIISKGNKVEAIRVADSSKLFVKEKEIAQDNLSNRRGEIL